MRSNILRALLASLALLCLPVFANEAADPFAQAVHGPAQIPLRDQAVMNLPDGFVFLPKEPGIEVMQRMGNRTDERFMGLVFPKAQNAQWFVLAEYEAAGYIKDDDAKEWDADALLQNLKDGTEAANEERRAAQQSELEVTGWAEVPRYDAASHRLVWSALARTKGAPANEAATINYNTYALGREGYISLNLVTDSSTIAADKPAANILLSALDFNEGKRYQDFNASTDKVAEYGLAALVGGLAAKKLGIFAMIGVFFAKFFKVIMVAGIALVAGLGKFLGRRKSA